MPDRTINFGDGATEASYQAQDTDAANGGGTFRLRDLANSVDFLAWDPTTQTLTTAGSEVATVAGLNDTIDLIQVADIDSLPDATTVTEPTIAYIDAEDDYVGVFQS